MPDVVWVKKQVEMAEMAPESKVIAIDFCAIYIAYKNYKDKYPNMIFAKGDISNTKINDSMIDFTLCDQVIKAYFRSI